jgi:predicted proteasome-type protease
MNPELERKVEATINDWLEVESKCNYVDTDFGLESVVLDGHGFDLKELGLKLYELGRKEAMEEENKYLRDILSMQD